ncbi:MAG: hypothetical protein V1717_02480 [Candidatus Micrarchaeota archaeon]
MNVVLEKENKLFDRKEVVAEFDSQAGTVSRKHVLQELKKKYQGEIVVESVEQKFGKKTVLVKARVYANAEKARAIEPKWRFERTEGKKEAGGEAKPAA